MDASIVRLGTAGWSLRAEHKRHFPDSGTHLQRYSKILNAVEVNSSFYRSHRPQTWAKWSESTGEDFRFSVKAPRQITHYRRLKNVRELWESFWNEVGLLGEKLRVVLFQLPPTLAFDQQVASRFFLEVRDTYHGPVVLEPRHPSWFTPTPEKLLDAHRISRVAVDPHPCGLSALQPAGDTSFVYFRLHGHPKIYYSNYSDEYLEDLRKRIQECAADEVWCIFDNTAEGHATFNALTIQEFASRSQQTST
ncbi:protein containing DUF72 [Rhodopirellula maiorica SM1]|uniref:Protein containing DUF72 n=1 Tax=Rhodopirellula maiorica SM1 TaxID=1265738 RepID=M5RIM7_9BACT|nr:DUF72 domain-containing protein [Rhodopirellula maiorica]EMI19056.1 protein containing DUF72 [Rhodopirellula maiorica SM1]